MPTTATIGTRNQCDIAKHHQRRSTLKCSRLNLNNKSQPKLCILNTRDALLGLVCPKALAPHAYMPRKRLASHDIADNLHTCTHPWNKHLHTNTVSLLHTHTLYTPTNQTVNLYIYVPTLVACTNLHKTRHAYQTDSISPARASGGGCR